MAGLRFLFAQIVSADFKMNFYVLTNNYKKMKKKLLTLLLALVAIATTGRAQVVLNETNFPDANFRKALAEILQISEGSVISKEMISTTKEVDIHRKSIADLTGIEHFTALTYLDCGDNRLTSLDVSRNTALTKLNCTYNYLTSLNISKNTKMQKLWCSHNKLISIEVSGCSTLWYLDCGDNHLTSLDVSKNTALSSFRCHDNRLTSLDVMKNTALSLLYCEGNYLTSLDVSKNTNLGYVWCYSNQIKGEAMNKLVSSLPTVNEREIIIINTKDENEENVCTKAQVAVAKAKGWTVYDYGIGKYPYPEYEGSEDAEPAVSAEAIDLGLPSGTKWANMNVGASRPEEYGTYFAWGETLGKNSYTWDNYMCPEMTCGKSGDPVFDLVGDKADIAGTKFDAATMNWGDSWQMPTAKQIEELASNCYSSLVTINGVQCRKLKSRINGNEIVFPLAGARWYESFAYEGSLCYYWGSTLRQGGYVSPGRLIVEDDRHGWGWSMGGENDRFCGFPIRPIYKGSSQPEITSDSCLIVWHKDGSIAEFELQEKPKIIFLDNRVEVITSSLKVEYDFSAIEKMTYELKSTDAIPEIASDGASSPFVAEGGYIKFFSSKEDLNIRIFSLNGNLIKQHFVKRNESYSFPLYALPKGVYLIRVNNITNKVSIK